MEILLIEPSQELTETVRRRLTDDGYTAVCVSNGTDALKLLDSLRFESILLEWSLPDMDGVDVLRELRTRRLDTPVMVLSSRACVADRVLALDSGADDYLLRPFHLDECMARVRRMVRTYQRRTPPEYDGTNGGIHCIADLTVDLTQHVATRSGKRLLLSAKESAILEYFAQHAGKILTRAEIEAHISAQDAGSGLVPVYIHYLRQKIDEGHPLPLLHTVRGKGYMLSANPMRKPRRCFRPVTCAV
ncbi:MAG TPA: DNA-binding response regulator [Ruminococcus sp.]|nr:DNA-binding response regulator [Ruminococcus sp.]